MITARSVIDVERYVTEPYDLFTSRVSRRSGATWCAPDHPVADGETVGSERPRGAARHLDPHGQPSSPIGITTMAGWREWRETV